MCMDVQAIASNGHVLYVHSWFISIHTSQNITDYRHVGNLRLSSSMKTAKGSKAPDLWQFLDSVNKLESCETFLAVHMAVGTCMYVCSHVHPPTSIAHMHGTIREYPHVGYKVLWYQLEGGWKSLKGFDCDAPVVFRAKMTEFPSTFKLVSESSVPYMLHPCFSQIRSPYFIRILSSSQAQTQCGHI